MSITTHGLPAALAVSALLLFLGACSGGEGECGSRCRNWQFCDEGVCRPEPGRCATDEDCDSAMPICELETATCISHRCDPVCLDWQVCLSGACETAEGYCGRHIDCEVLCDFATHQCAADYCEPACEGWQVCAGTTCEPAEGRCLTDIDCPADKPVCSVVTRNCGPAAGSYTEVSLTAMPAVIVTSDALRAPMETLARLHTVTGLPTRVVTVAEICAAATCVDADPASDSAKAIKAWLGAQTGLRWVVLGGDLEHVPSRQVHDTFQKATLSLNWDEDFESDHYYADLSNWDTNGDGRYAVPGEDTPDLVPELGVGRIPVSTVAEAEAYLAKVVRHMTAYERARVGRVLALANVMGSVNNTWPLGGDYYLEERTLALLPAGSEVVKLYPGAHDGATKLTLELEKTELNAGPNLVLHAGQAAVDALTQEPNGSLAFTGELAATLISDPAPFFLSSAGLAGRFSAADSAGERLVLARGGAIGYLGATGSAFGVVGSAQLVDALVEQIFARRNPRLVEALFAARESLPAYDVFQLGNNWPLEAVDVDSWAWTQKTSVWLGDPLVPIWTDVDVWQSPTMSVERRTVDASAQLRFTLFPPVNGTLWVLTDGRLYTAELVEATAAMIELPEKPARISAGVTAENMMPAWFDQTY